MFSIRSRGSVSLQKTAPTAGKVREVAHAAAQPRVPRPEEISPSAAARSPEADLLRAEIIAVGRKLWERSYVDGNGGNISVRFGAHSVLALHDPYANALRLNLAAESGDAAAVVRLRKELIATAQHGRDGAYWEFDGFSPFYGWGEGGRLETTAMALAASALRSSAIAQAKTVRGRSRSRNIR